MAELPTKYIVAAALVDVDGRVLLAQRPDDKPMAGLWEFPGGKIEAGETPEAALIRELQEELSIDTKSSCLAPLSFASHSYETFHLVMLLYICRRWWAAPSRLKAVLCNGLERLVCAILRCQRQICRSWLPYKIYCN